MWPRDSLVELGTDRRRRPRHPRRAGLCPELRAGVVEPVSGDPDPLLPVLGVFTTILEQMADPKGTSETFTTPELAQGVCPTDDPSSCVFAGG